MKKNEIIKTVVITSLILLVFIINGFMNREEENAKNVYQVYLNGQKLGLINSKDELYSLINESQKDIKEEYNVENVYPPNGFAIKEYNTYDDNISDVNTVYNKIKSADDFTISGYTVKIKSNDKDKDDIILYVTSEDVFKEALNNVITAFVNEDDYKNYINNTQSGIDDVGKIIEKMYFEETITIKPTFISIKEKIYKDASELTKYLMFGTTKSSSTYKIAAGDTISSISEANKLNVKEFLIANPKYKDENAMLAIGDTVNISLINPVLTLVENLHVVEDVEQVYTKEVVYDKDKPTSFSEVTQKGITGIVRSTQKVQVVNGEQNQGVEKISDVTIRETQDEITTKGGTKAQYRPSTSTPTGPIRGSYIDTGLDWGWPTNRPYIITSGFEWRWGSFHNAIDISGTGMGSPIYAAEDGVITEVVSSCANVGYYRSMCGGSYGNHVIVKHDNGMYTMYAHLIKKVPVRVGQSVSRGQVIGYMGSSGSSTGTHLHFGVSVGEPNKGGTWISPWRLYR